MKRRATDLAPSRIAVAVALAMAAGGLVGCVADPDQLCPAEADPCVIVGTHDIDSFSFLDFDGRAVVLAGTLRIGSGFVSITAGSLRMIACRRAMRATPMASVTVTAAGRASGTAPTAKATAA